MDNDVFVVSALRTAFGKFCGTLRETPTYELGAFVIEEALQKAGVSKEQVDEVFMGCAIHAENEDFVSPIVVNDSRGFFTSRVFTTFLEEGCKLLKEGIDPILIDALARQAGMPVGPLAIHDEVSQELTRKLGETNQELDEARGENYCRLSATTDEIARCLIEEFGRRGRVYGGGYYEYPADGKKFIWGEGILSACGKACKNLW